MEICKLFEGISKEELEKLMCCLSPVTRSFEKGEIVVMTGENLSSVIIVKTGSLEGRKENAQGDSIIISRLAEGGVIGEALCASGKPSPVTVFATEPCELMYIPFDRIMSTCSCSCSHHRKLLLNLTRLLSQEYFSLHDRISCLMLKSLRSKVWEYLLLCAKNSGSSTFEVPFDREDMASYLGCDRSALSRELAKMKSAGLIDYHKNTFKIK